MNDIVMNKKESIERCIRQIRAYYALPREIAFAEDHLRQDAIALNLQRACEQCIDLANHAIRTRKLGLPKESRESFRLLAQHRIIPPELAGRLEGMVGFRNVLVHEYQKLNLAVLVEIIEHRLDDLERFSTAVMEALSDGSA